MTIIDVINRIDALKPNRYEQCEKIKWLSTLDTRIVTDIISTHEGAEVKDFDGYNEDTVLSTELLAAAPYDDMYLHWLEAQIDYWNGEYTKYNNSMAMFDAMYTAFASHYNRTHMPKGKKFGFF